MRTRFVKLKSYEECLEISKQRAKSSAFFVKLTESDLHLFGNKIEILSEINTADNLKYHNIINSGSDVIDMDWIDDGIINGRYLI